MTHPAINPDQPESVQDFGVSWIRTTVPVIWGSFLTWVASQVPGLEPVMNQPAAVGFSVVLVGVLTVVWYSIMRKLETVLPPWLTRIVIGANRRPVYIDPDAPVVAHRAGIPRTVDGA
jgi:xanthine/uracil permease